MPLLVYGAYGYSGRLITREAVERGLRPILAGRNRERLNQWGQTMGLQTRAAALDARDSLRSVLDDISVVLHCAGPFVRTAWPMVEACLDTGTHYLDITGEPDVFRQLIQRGPEAEEGDVMVLPGVGFDVVATDCLAQYVAHKVPGATTLEVAVQAAGGVSAGTLKTIIERMGEGGLVRREGALVEVPPGWASRRVRFGNHSRTVISIPEGSVVTSGHSTDVPNVTAYVALPRLARILLRVSRFVSGLLASTSLKRGLQQFVEWRGSGPSPEDRRLGHTVVWAAARKNGNSPKQALLSGPDAYTFTARTAVTAVERVLAGEARPGYQTPSTAFGADFPLGVDGVTREDIAGPES